MEVEAVAFGLVAALVLEALSLPLTLKPVSTKNLGLKTISRDQWDRVFERDGVIARLVVLAFLEVTLYFACLAVKAYPALAGLLALKVASKWAVWQHIERVPESFDDSQPAFDNWAVRHALATQLLQMFLIGTFSSLLWASIGYAVTKCYTPC